MARNMATKSAAGGHIRHISSRKAARRFGFVSHKALLGMGLAIGGWIAGSFASMHGVALSMQERTIEAPVLAARHAGAAPQPEGLRMVRSVKFKRIAPATDKAERLANADLSYRSVNRPDDGDVRERVLAAFKADNEQRRVADLLQKRPEADAIRTALVAALGDTVILAPRTDVAWDAELRDTSIEVASVDPDTIKAMQSVDVETTVAEAASGQLPASGPVPMRRPVDAPVAVASIETPKPAARPARSVAQVSDDDDDTASTGSSSALAFARPDNPVKNIARSVPWPDQGTKIAVYDISNGVVHMPNGQTLEAHSGIGEMRDNPKFTHVKMRGPTPPGTYKLSMREKLFHGVAAIRLNPVDGVAPKGRTGLLAHSYLLARRGDSHGCVAFASYDKFLKAFQRGEVTHMIIVDRHDGSKPILASATGKEKKTLLDMFR